MNEQEKEIANNRTASKKRTIRYLVILAVMIAGGLVLKTCIGGTDKEGAAAHKGGMFGGANFVMPVGTSFAQKGDLKIVYNAIGTVTSLASVTVKTQINGQLTRVAFQEGQLVKKGDFLAEVDPRPYANALLQAEGQKLKDEALLKDAQLNLERYKKLVEEDGVSHQQVDTQASLVQQYQGTVKADEAQVATAKLNLSYCYVSAPVSGRVGLRQVDEGNYVQTSDSAGIVTITQLQPITVLFSLPEDNLPTLMRNGKDKAQFDVSVYDRDQKIELAKGKVTSMDNQIDVNTGTIKLRAELANAEEKLFPNQFVNVRLLAEILHDQLYIPSAAIQRGSVGSFVYVVNADKSVAMRPIKTALIDGDKIAVTEGLNEGDRVVIDGADKLKDGAKVSLPDEKEEAKTDVLTPSSQTEKAKQASPEVGEAQTDKTQKSTETTKKHKREKGS